MDTDLTLQHRRAAETADVRQRALGLRWAAHLLATAPPPAGKIQADTVRSVWQRLIADAALLEERAR